jgi:hypothetical protein
MVGARPNVRLATGRVGSIGDDTGQTLRALEIAAVHRGNDA